MPVSGRHSFSWFCLIKGHNSMNYKSFSTFRDRYEEAHMPVSGRHSSSWFYLAKATQLSEL